MTINIWRVLTMATRRGYMRAELLRAVHNLEMTLTHLTRVRDAYREQHPEIAEIIQTLGDRLIEVADYLVEVRERI